MQKEQIEGLNEKIREFKVISVNVDSVTIDPENPNKMSGEQMSGLRASMQRFGYLEPIIIDQNNMVADGEHRLLVYKDLNMTKIPAFRISLENDAERKLLRQTMNKLRGQHDPELDSQELLLLHEKDMLPELETLIGADLHELQRLIYDYHPDLDPYRPEPELTEQEIEDIEPIVKLGDIWQLGKHRLICDDCTSATTLQRLCNEKAQMVFTDPPYNLDYASGTSSKERAKMGKIVNDKQSESDYIAFLTKCLKNIKDVITNTCDQYICSDWKVYHLFRTAILQTEQKIANVIIWNKESQAQALNKYANAHEFILFIGNNKGPYKDINVWNCHRDFDPDHPTPKPTELISKAIRYSDPPMIILDAFAGSGSTLIACEQTNRICYAAEIDPHYCDVTIARWEKYSGKKAKKVKK